MRERGFDAKKDQVMRLLKVVVIVLTAMVTQSCKITMPSPIELLSAYVPYDVGRPNAYNFSKSRALGKQTGLKDTLVIGDKPDTDHGKSMYETINAAFTGRGEGRTDAIAKNSVFFPDFAMGTLPNDGNVGLKLLLSDKWTKLREATRIAHIPYNTPLRESREASRVMSTEILFVLSAGNMYSFLENDRDMYNASHSRWNHPNNPARTELSQMRYGYMLDVYSTGKAIAATSAQVNENGTVEPFERVVSCGDIKEACFTVIPPQYTSHASARLASMSFYLSQFWETPEEVVEVLKQCAIDVGEPGVDREYGQGVANLLCPVVLKKEVEVVAQYVEKTEESFETRGGVLDGVFEAESSVLEVYIPAALQETVQPVYQGVVNGGVSFKGNTMTADFTAEASVQIDFLLLEAIEATVENVVQTEGVFTTMNDTLVLSDRTLTYTATADSLHLIQTYTLNEALALLPESFSSMLDRTSPDFFVNDPLQIRMSFAKAVPTLVGDFNQDGMVDVADFLLFVEAFGSVRGDRVFDEDLDIVPDGIISIADFLVFVDQFGKTLDS